MIDKGKDNLSEDMNRTDNYDYHLPRELIAQEPIEPRDSSRLLVLDNKSGCVSHRIFHQILDIFEPGDLLIVNDTKVIPARLFAKKVTGGRVEILMDSLHGEGRAMLCADRPIKSNKWKAFLKGKNIKPSSKLFMDDIPLTVFVEKRIHEGLYLISFFEGDGLFEWLRSREDWISVGTGIHFSGEDGITLQNILDAVGVMPTPPYIKKELDRDDRYQTIYAGDPGAIAAPTAGLHFTEGLLKKIDDIGITRTQVTLHVGTGTFRPVKAERVDEHEMDMEFISVSEECSKLVNQALDNGDRIWVVGTTTMRTLETLFSKHDRLRPYSGNTGIFIYPPYRFKTPSNFFLTNFHLPRSTLIMMISAYCGRDRILKTYREAIESEYRFYSFGDAMLIRGRPLL